MRQCKCNSASFKNYIFLFFELIASICNGEIWAINEKSMNRSIFWILCFLFRILRVFIIMLLFVLWHSGVQLCPYECVWCNVRVRLFIIFIFGYWINGHTFTQYMDVCDVCQRCTKVDILYLPVYPFTTRSAYEMQWTSAMHHVRSEQWVVCRELTFLLYSYIVCIVLSHCMYINVFKMLYIGHYIVSIFRVWAYLFSSGSSTQALLCICAIRNSGVQCTTMCVIAKPYEF